MISGTTQPAPSGVPHFLRVIVSPERVIRTVVGLRPFRSPGFRLQTDRLDQKTVIHNYGHGGGGMALFSVSPLRAAPLAPRPPHPPLAGLLFARRRTPPAPPLPRPACVVPR